MESYCPFLQILVYNFSWIVSAICVNGSAEMHSIIEGEGFLLWGRVKVSIDK